MSNILKFMFGFVATIAYLKGLNGSQNEIKVLRVGTIIDPPYIDVVAGCIANTTAGTQEQNACYNGFCKDILLKISEDLKINFTISQVKKEYGDLVEGEWNGLIGSLKNKEIDLGLAAFSITSERQKVVDFTTKFEMKNHGSKNAYYALALQKDSEHTKSFSRLIEKLVNQRYLEQLVEVWWNENPAVNETFHFTDGKH